MAKRKSSGNTIKGPLNADSLIEFLFNMLLFSALFALDVSISMFRNERNRFYYTKRSHNARKHKIQPPDGDDTFIRGIVEASRFCMPRVVDKIERNETKTEKNEPLFVTTLPPSRAPFSADCVSLYGSAYCRRSTHDTSVGWVRRVCV